MKAIYPAHSFGSVSLPIWQYNVIRKFSQHRKYRVLLGEFGPTIFEYLCQQSGFNHKELLQKREAGEILENECQVLLNNFGEMKMYWWWPWSRKIKDVKLTEAQWERAINYDDSSFLWRLVLSVFTNVIAHQWHIAHYGYVNNYQRLKGVEMQNAKNIAIGVSAAVIGAGVATAVSTVRTGVRTGTEWVTGTAAGISETVAAFSTVSSYFPGIAVGGVGALVIEDRFSSLIKAIIMSGETDSPTLSEELKSFKLQWLLMDLDTSLQEMEVGKKTKNEHNEYAKEKIKSVQRLSLKCHPDVTHMATTGTQQKVGSVLKAVRKVHDYVIETRRGHGYLYRLFGELSVELINNEENLSKLVNIVACGKLRDIAYWEEGRLMENRNYYLKSAREHYVKLCKNKLSLLKDLLKTEPVPIEGIISIRGMIGKVKKELDEDIQEYKKLYGEVWVKNLKKLSEECKKEEKLQVIKPEIDELLKKSHEQYEILQGKKTGKVKADETFVQPILEYSNLMNMYYKLTMKFSKDIEKGRTQNDVIYLSQQKFVLGEENTGFTNASKEYIKELSEQELCKFVELMVGFYCDKQGREKLQDVIYGYYPGRTAEIYEIGNVLIFALSRLAELLEEKFVEKETFFQKEEKRRAEAVKESEAIKKLIEKYEQQATQADQRTEQANQRAAQEAQAREEAEQKAAQEAQEKEEFKQKAAQEAQEKEEEKRGRLEAEQRAERANQRTKITKLLGRLLRSFDDELYKTVEENEDAIVEAVMKHVMEHNSSPEQMLNTIMEEIKRNKDDILSAENATEAINAAIESAIMSFNSQGTSMSSVNISQAGTGITR